MNKLLKEWKHRLQLDDWHIELIENCSPNDMVLKDCAGETEWSEVGKTAVIRIIDPKDYGKRIEPFDFEKNTGSRIIALQVVPAWRKWQ